MHDDISILICYPGLPVTKPTFSNVVDENYKAHHGAPCTEFHSCDSLMVLCQSSDFIPPLHLALL